MKPTISLSHLEQSLPEGILEAGERHLQEGRVEHLREVDRHLWQARVRMEEYHELEVLLRGRRVQAFSCDCSAGLRRKPCSHLVAVLLMLRRYLDQQLEKRRAGTKAPPALTVPGLLPVIPAAELQAFLGEWAARNPEFAQSLKARFLHFGRSDQAAAQLLRLLEPCLDEEGRMDSDSGASKRGTLVLEQVVRQLETRLAGAEESEAYALGGTVLALLERSSGFRQRDTWIRKMVQALIIQPADRPVHPDGARFLFLLDALQRLFRSGAEDAMHLVLVSLGAYLGFQEAREQVRAVCADLLRHREAGLRHLDGLLLVYYQLLSETERQGPWLADLGLPRLPPPTFQKLAASLLEAGDFEEAALLLQEGLEHYPRHLDLLRLRTRALWELHRWEALAGVAMQLLCTGMAPADLQQAREWLPQTQWDHLTTNLRQHLEAMPGTWERNHLLAALLLATVDLPALGQLIPRSQSVRLWRSYASALADRDANLAITCSWDFLEHYLQDHLGPQANATAREVMQFLAVRMDRRSLETMKQRLLKLFPERPQLVSLWPTATAQRMMYEG